LKNGIPVFSVLINNYNYADYLKVAIESVLEQTFKDFELIVVDDGSTDLSKDIIDSFDDERIIRIYKENGGQASAFNVGFEKCTGQYVAFLDSDDTFDINKLEIIYGIFQRYDYAAVQHKLRVIDSEGVDMGKLHPGGILIGDHDLLGKYFEMNRTNLYSSTSGIVVPRRLLKNILPIPEKEWRICADVPLFRPLALMGRVYTMSEPAGSYRIHGSNGWMNTEQQSEKSLEMLLRSNSCVNSFLKIWGIDKKVTLPAPVEELHKAGFISVTLYGAGLHTRRLLAEGLSDQFRVSYILDDNPQNNDMDGIPVIRTDDYQSAGKEAVLVSSDIHEPAMASTCIKLKLPYIYTMYHFRQFIPEKKPEVSKAVLKLKKDGIKKIALYGAGFHTLNLLHSGMLYDIKVEYILDDGNYDWFMNGIPVIHPSEMVEDSFEAVLISSDIHERNMFYQAASYGIEKIYCIYGPQKAPKASYADYRDIRNAFYKSKDNYAILYGFSYYNACLLQCEAVTDYVHVRCILDSRPQKIDFLNGVLVVTPENLKDEDKTAMLIVPPLQSAYEGFNGLEKSLFTQSLVIRQNIDEIELVHRYFEDIGLQDGVMLDVGAHMGNSLKPFADSGWQVYAFEPEPVMRHRLENGYSHYPNVIIEKIALSDREQEDIPIYKSDVSSGITTLSPFHESHRLTAYVQVSTLKIFAKKNNIKSTDFLKIDTEGYDFPVLKGNSWETLRPRIIMCEFENRKTVKLGYTFYEMADFLVSKGYRLLISEWEPVFEYGRQPRWRAVRPYPCKLFDPEAYGNILAFREAEDLDNIGRII